MSRRPRSGRGGRPFGAARPIAIVKGSTIPLRQLRHHLTLPIGAFWRQIQADPDCGLVRGRGRGIRG
jgi:hypothetical protein